MPPERSMQAAASAPGKCSRCGGTGVLIEPDGAIAQAAVCSCSIRCTVCRGAKFLFERDSEGREIARLCECEVRRQRIRLYNEAGIPSKYADARLVESRKDKDNSQAFLTFAAFANQYQRGSKGLLVVGGPGVGKTYLLCALLHDLIFHHGVPAQFRDFFHLLADLRSGYAQDKAESELIQPLVEVEVLAIDELGKGRNTPWEQNILDVIISHRYNSKKTTIFTSNYTDSKATTLAEPLRSKDSIASEAEQVRETLKERVGPRIYSRLGEMCDFVEMKGRDRRESLSASM